jgi:hypothetical protein
MTTTTRPVVFMDINIGETPAGRIKMELFSDIVPKCVLISSLRQAVANSIQESQFKTAGIQECDVS